MNVIEGKMTQDGIKVGIVVARFNEFITSKLLGGAKDGLVRHDVPEENIDVAWVPGAFEIPLIAKKMAKSGKYDAVICLGAVIRGATSHYDYVCNEVSKGIASVSLESEIPVMFGVVTTENIEQAKEKGLSALNYKDISVDVEIKGMNYEIGSYTAADLVATVNLDDVTKEGTYDLDIDVKSSHSTDKVTVVSVNPDTVSVEFDRLTTKTIPLTAEAPLISAEEGYILKETTTSPSEITIEGPKNDLDNISKAVAQISKSKKISEDTTINTQDIRWFSLFSLNFCCKNVEEQM